MARARNIKPGFFTNDVLAECEPLARILFAGLWTIADRAGRLEDRPKKIKAEILPYDNCNVDKLLNELSDRRFILRYEVDGVRYIQILAFEKHQNPHVKEAASTIPAPDKHSANTVQDTTQTGTSHADSLNPITDSLVPMGAPNAARSTLPAKITFDLQAATFKAITPEDRERWRKAYPAIDVKVEIEKAAAWLKANPKNLKSNYERFLVAWFARAQDKAPRVAVGTPTTNGKPWFIQSASAIEAKGRELGIDPDAFPFPEFRLRVFKAAGITRDMEQKALKEFA